MRRALLATNPILLPSGPSLRRCPPGTACPASRTFSAQDRPLVCHCLPTTPAGDHYQMSDRLAWPPTSKAVQRRLAPGLWKGVEGVDALVQTSFLSGRSVVTMWCLESVHPGFRPQLSHLLCQTVSVKRFLFLNPRFCFSKLTLKTHSNIH